MRFLGTMVAFGIALTVMAGTAWAQGGYYSLTDSSPAATPVAAAIGGCDGCDGSGCSSCDGGCNGACDGGCSSCDGGCDVGCDGGCGGSCCGGGWCDLGEPFRLFGDECSAIQVGGWFQFGYTSYDTGQFNDHPYNVDLNQAYIYLEKVADGSCGLDWGFRADYVYGTDGQDTQSFGGRPNFWDNPWDAGGFYGHAIPQLYAELAYQDLSVKIGHFYTILGYEVVPATGNFFYSHAFTMNNGEPFTHTGVLAQYKMNDVTFWGGYTLGWDTGFESNGGDNFLGGISAPISDDVTLTYAVTAGNIGFGGNSSGYSHSIVADVALTENVQYIFQTDYTGYPGQNEAVGVNQYLIHSLNDCVAHGIRLEWWNTEIAPGNRADLYEITYGFNVRPHANVLIRPEIRWDKDDDGFTIPAAHNEQLGFGLDVITTF